MGDSIPESVPPAPTVVVVAKGHGETAVVGQPDAAVVAARGAVDIARSVGSTDVTVITRDVAIDQATPSKPAGEVDVHLVAGTTENWPAILAGLLRSGDRPIVVADSDSVVSPWLARSVAAAGSTSVIVAAADDSNVVGAVSGVPIQIDRGFVDGLASPGEATTLAMSWLVVAAGDAAAVASELDTMPPGDAQRSGEVLVPAILRAGVALRAVRPRHHPIGSAVDPNAAAALEVALDEADVDSSRIASAVKAADGPFTTYCVSPYSRFIAAFGARRGWTPNAVTAFSLLLGLGAAFCFLDDRIGILALGAVLLISSFVFDCVDGQLARITLNFSSRGAWLDLYSDRVKEFAMLAALAVGAGSTRSSWMLAGLTVAALSVRHTANVTFTINESAILLRRRSALPSAPVVASTRLVDADRAPVTERRRGLRYWLPWMLRFTIGDRLFVVSCALLVGGQQWALIALGVGSVFAMVAQVGLRVLRTRQFAREPFVPEASARVLTDFGVTDRWRLSWDRPFSAVRPIVASGLVAAAGGLSALAIAIDAPVGALVALAALVPAALFAGGVGGGAWWLVPTSSRLVDVLVLLAVVVVVAEPWLGVCCLMIVALRHSDLTFRSPSKLAAAAFTSGTGGGLAARLLVVIVAIGLDRPIVGLWVIVAVVAVQTSIDVATQLRTA